MTRPLFMVWAAVLFLVAGEPVAAQQFEDIGTHRVHYSTLNTALLPPAVASAYGIQRSGSRALLNIAVLQKASSSAALDEPVRAAVSARAVNLSGQQRSIVLEEIVDDSAVYYIGTFRISNEETLLFTVDVRPAGDDSSVHSFEFQQQFFTER